MLSAALNLLLLSVAQGDSPRLFIADFARSQAQKQMPIVNWVLHSGISWKQALTLPAGMQRKQQNSSALVRISTKSSSLQIMN